MEEFKLQAEVYKILDEENEDPLCVNVNSCSIIYQNDPKIIINGKKSRVNQFKDKTSVKDNELMYKIMNVDLITNHKKYLKHLAGQGIWMLVVWKHVFHKKWIEAWFKDNNSCPFCRKEAYIRPGEDSSDFDGFENDIDEIESDEDSDFEDFIHLEDVGNISSEDEYPRYVSDSDIHEFSEDSTISTDSNEGIDLWRVEPYETDSWGEGSAEED